MATEIRYYTANPVTPIADAIFADSTVSYKEVGLYSQIVHIGQKSRAGEWDFSAAGVTALHSDGRASVRSGLEGLEKKGYLLRAARKAGARPDDDQVWVAFDRPDPGSWLEVAGRLAQEGCTPLGETASYHAWPGAPEGGFVKRPNHKYYGDGRKTISEAENQLRKEITESENQLRKNLSESENQLRKKIAYRNVKNSWSEHDCNDVNVKKFSEADFPLREIEHKYTYVCMDRSNPSICAVENSSAEKGDVENHGSRPSAPDIAEAGAAAAANPLFDEALTRMRSTSRNRNRIKEAPAALTALVRQGFDPSEVADAWDDHTESLVASGRESAMWTQLTKWLEEEAADAVRDRRYRQSTASKGSRRDARAGTAQKAEAAGFDPVSYSASLRRPAPDAASPEEIPLSFSASTGCPMPAKAAFNCFPKA